MSGSVRGAKEQSFVPTRQTPPRRRRAPRLPGEVQDAQPGREDVEAERNALRTELAKLAGSLLCARGGMDVMGSNAQGKSADPRNHAAHTLVG